jgi:photosystem II stability/assembly factor-like uncharacterized protein
MNESAVRRRLREAFGESVYPPDLTSRVAARIAQPQELRQRTNWLLAAVAAVLAIALVATILLGAHTLRGRAVVPVNPPVAQGPSPTSCQSSNAVDQTGVVQAVTKTVTMFTPSSGWAAGGLRTTDGGAHWHSTLPTSITSAPTAQGTYAREFSEFYRDSDHGWALRTYATSRACLDHADVWSTLDGGGTWSKLGTVSFALPPDFAPTILELTFFDDRHGWLWATLGSVNGPYGGFSGIAESEAQLFATGDGGVSWRLVSTVTREQIGLPQPGICVGAFSDLKFSDVSTAWMGVQCLTSGGALLVTHDGGASWKLESTRDPCGCTFPQPRFFDARHGVVELYNMAEPYGPAAVLSTSDGGRTWQALPAIPEPGYSMGIAYVDANHWWDLVTQPTFGRKGDPTQDWLYRTDDGGHTWRLVQTGLPLGFPVWGLYFFDANDGWAIQPADNTHGLPPDNVISNGKDEVLQTSDGGHTWSVTATVSAAKS